MSWLTDIFSQQTDIQAVIIISMICACGLALGKIKVKGVGLGITFVFIFGILAGVAGLSIDGRMLQYAQSFGLILFVYTLGLQIGPGFISALKSGGFSLNLLSIGVILIATLMALICVWTGCLKIDEVMGILCGSTTNAPALGAAQQTLAQFGHSTTNTALGMALTYPLGMVGVIFAIIIVKKYLTKHQSTNLNEETAEDAFIATFKVSNPAIFGRTLHEINNSDDSKFVASRLWRGDKVILPDANTHLEEGDRLMVITMASRLDELTIFFGQREEKDWNKNDIDWNAIDRKLMSQRILITRSAINGKRLADLNLRARYGVTVSRVKRSGILLVATPNLRLRMGDRITAVGETENLKMAAAELGDTVKNLEEPNMVTIFIGIVLGLILGCIPFKFPGMSFPVSLGLAGGPIVMGLLIGSYGPRLHMVAYTTTSASLMLRSLGLSMFLACLGLSAGEDLAQTGFNTAMLSWIGYGFIFTIVPVIIMAFVSVLICRKSFATSAGMLCGAMANPIALTFVNDTIESEKSSVAYATVYPLGMFLRVIIAQIIVLICI